MVLLIYYSAVANTGSDGDGDEAAAQNLELPVYIGKKVDCGVPEFLDYGWRGDKIKSITFMKITTTIKESNLISRSFQV